MAYSIIHVRSGEALRVYTTLKGARIALTQFNQNAGWQSFVRYSDNGIEQMHGRMPYLQDFIYGLAPYGIKQYNA